MDGKKREKLPHQHQQIYLSFSSIERINKWQNKNYDEITSYGKRGIAIFHYHPFRSLLVLSFITLFFAIVRFLIRICQSEDPLATISKSTGKKNEIIHRIFLCPLVKYVQTINMTMAFECFPPYNLYNFKQKL